MVASTQSSFYFPLCFVTLPSLLTSMLAPPLAGPGYIFEGVWLSPCPEDYWLPYGFFWAVTQITKLKYLKSTKISDMKFWIFYLDFILGFI